MKFVGLNICQITFVLITQSFLLNLLLFKMLNLLWLIVSISAISDPWATLGISRSATSKQIKQAYKKLAKEWHPDVNKSPEAEAMFIDIAEAYQILTDDEKKREWERNQNSGFGSSFRRSSSRTGSSFGFRKNFKFSAI